MLLNIAMAGQLQAAAADLRARHKPHKFHRAMLPLIVLSLIYIAWNIWPKVPLNWLQLEMVDWLGPVVSDHKMIWSKGRHLLFF